MTSREQLIKDARILEMTDSDSNEYVARRSSRHAHWYLSGEWNTLTPQEMADFTDRCISVTVLASFGATTIYDVLPGHCKLFRFQGEDGHQHVALWSNGAWHVTETLSPDGLGWKTLDSIAQTCGIKLETVRPLIDDPDYQVKQVN